MLICKIGSHHVENGMNCQDFGFIDNDIKCVVDGCSEGENSEVGAKLFCHMFKNGMGIEDIFDTIINMANFDYKDIRNYLCFTILFIKETDDNFIVYYCGDGYIITQNHSNKMEFEKLDDGEYPQYFAYNYIDESHLKHYKNGVFINSKVYPKIQYKNIGIATDGLRYMFEQDFTEDFVEYLSNNKESGLKRLINREHKYFKDDITVIF